MEVQRGRGGSQARFRGQGISLSEYQAEAFRELCWGAAVDAESGEVFGGFSGVLRGIKVAGGAISNNGVEPSIAKEICVASIGME